ncbi:MAG TPA: hypothetical protein VJO52_10555 [Gemmatimonadaceae bacterium]|nr:hypothetical protein [Gemmatimonadaceae bacterium]
MTTASCRRAIALALLSAAFAPVACKKSPPPQQGASAQPSQPAAGPAQPDDGNPAPAWIDNPQPSPGTTVLTAIDPHTLSASEVKFGIAPKRSPDVEYQPDVIVMEHGDQAIRAAGGDGLSWTFDANAPNVSDFQPGKVVFATGRAVGRILALKHDGSTVTAILGPVQLTDIIKNGRFQMSQEVDQDKMIAYTAPDYPGMQSDTGTAKPASLELDGDASGGAAGRFASLDMQQQVPASPNVPNPLGAAQQVMGAIPSVNADDDNLTLKPVASNSGVGLQYYYTPKGGPSATASGVVNLHKPVVKCVFRINNGAFDSAGISIEGSAGIKLSLDSYSSTTTFINMHVQHWVPVDFSIPLGGPVPLSLTFATMFNVNSGFSAKSSKMEATGEYSYGGKIFAGRAGGQWQLSGVKEPKTITDLTESLSNVSVGINSFTMAFSIRALVGLGAFGFNTGVYAAVRFGGSLLASPSGDFPCRQATLGVYLDSGIGWQTPGWVVAAINVFLRPITGTAIDAAGDIWAAPASSIFTYGRQIPDKCASANKT